MKPAPFKYFAPKTLEEALHLVTEHGFDAKLIAGGQSLIPAMNFRLAQPAILIDLNRISSLFYVEDGDTGGLRIGAMTRQRVLERSALIAERSPLIKETMPFVAHPQIRNRGTIGGSIVHADPAAELPALMLALDAELHAKNGDQARIISAPDFFAGLFMTALNPDEILIEITVPPIPPRTGWAFREISRRHGDYALVGVATRITLDEAGNCIQAKIVFLSVGDAPVEAREAEKLLAGETPNEELLASAAEIASTRDIDPPNDIHASADYRRQLARVLTKRALGQALEIANQNL